ncbi:MAG: hypothetical protein PUA69_04125 [Erysipelotrichaceae bacterium]|nr:hypothetical protein [Erysipelotrichaceae bacterium]
MNDLERKYLALSLEKLRSFLPKPPIIMLAEYSEREDMYSVEGFDHDLVSCTFAYPVSDGEAERVIQLVYDDQEIIADCSGIFTDMNHMLYSENLYNCLCDESDWMYLEHFTLCSMLGMNEEYPPFKSKEKTDIPGIAFLFSNAYVTKSYRKQHIMTAMMDCTREFCARNAVNELDLYMAISLDPDVACYGPDASEKPYVYSMEQDEPKRKLNAEIAEKLGFTAIRLEAVHPEEKTDGSKLWFALCHEHDLIVESTQKTQA